MKFLGKQYFIELYDCNQEHLDNTEFIEQLMVASAKIANATVVQQFFHKFSPFGVSGTVVIAESHINIHTWPEHHYAAVDIFTCGVDLKAQDAISHLKEKLESSECKIEEVNRGDIQKIRTLS